MTTRQIVVSDLHLADGTSILDCFGTRQQSAFEGLLLATASQQSSLGEADEVELIINGDCFDFLVTTPYNSNKTTDVAIALQKIERILAAHRPFIAALRRFLAHPGRRITFLTGNHDIELCFAEVRKRITTAITEDAVAGADERIYFCPTRFYQPVPTVHIEHGNNYDFWNHAGFWDEQGQPLERDSQTLVLPVGSRYFRAAAHAISTQHPYFDHFDPPVNSTRQIALLCLLDADLLIKIASDTMELLSSPREPLVNLSLEDKRDPVKLFDAAIQDFAAFQTDMVAQKHDWTPSASEDPSISQDDITAYLEARAALSLPTREEAVAALCAPAPYTMGKEVAAGMHAILEKYPSLRYAIAGHTHERRAEQMPSTTTQEQIYFNTGSWTTHLSLPEQEEVTPELVSWLCKPDWNAVPLRDITQFLFVMVTSQNDAPATAHLCYWEGGIDGSYRIVLPT